MVMKMVSKLRAEIREVFERGEPTRIKASEAADELQREVQETRARREALALNMSTRRPMR